MLWESMGQPGSHGAYFAGRWSYVCCCHGSSYICVSWKVSSPLGRLHTSLLSSLTVCYWLCLLEVNFCQSVFTCKK